MGYAPEDAQVNSLVRQANESTIRLYRSLGYADMEDIHAMGKELGSHER